MKKKYYQNKNGVDKKTVPLLERVRFSISQNFSQPVSLLNDFSFIPPLSSSSKERERKRERERERERDIGL
jgi:hypothetical protein